MNFRHNNMLQKSDMNLLVRRDRIFLYTDAFEKVNDEDTDAASTTMG